jgi:hypothetical protein
MPPPEITPHDRGKALAELERIAHTLTQMSEWLGGAGEERSGVMLEEAWKNVVAAGWLLQRNPARTAALPNGQAAGPNGHGTGRRALMPGSPTPRARRS